ncbi:ATP-binding protein [Streptomyces sp. NBC_00183]|uniref:ATP-binding protein n=1 Tax=Streptomyces sp. NBC_00183 TaxID=2903633 RepID=UPI00224EC600|nr:ATP-binding protein [Streptomyces sp. NBC_00183]MCX5288596.1 ATP-binding protein [Streptomyces sp. NBC_00183]
MKSATPPNGHMPQHPAPEREFTMRFTSTPRGARLARRLVSHRLNDWGHPYTTPVNETLTLIAAELTANAVRHGHVPGRDFHLQLTLAEGTFRIEVTDTRAEKQPPSTPPTPDTASESGRGLLLIAALADDWGVTPRLAAPGKTVWAELRVPTGSRPHMLPAAPRPTDSVSAYEHNTESFPATSSLPRDGLGLRPGAASYGDRHP